MDVDRDTMTLVSLYYQLCNFKANIESNVIVIHNSPFPWRHAFQAVDSIHSQCLVCSSGNAVSLCHPSQEAVDSILLNNGDEINLSIAFNF